MRYYVDGPSGACSCADMEAAEEAIKIMAAMTGDDPDDYTVTDLENPYGAART